MYVCVCVLNRPSGGIVYISDAKSKQVWPKPAPFVPGAPDLPVQHVLPGTSVSLLGLSTTRGEIWW